MKKVQVSMYMSPPLLGCAYEEGNSGKARMPGLLHDTRDLRRVGDREDPGCNLGPAGFQDQGESPAKHTPWLVLKVLM